MFVFRMFELVAAIQLCMHTKLEDIPHDICQKTQQNKTPNRTLTEHSVDIESSMNPFFPTSFLPKTLSRKLDYCHLTLMKFNVMELTLILKIEYSIH